MSNQRSRRRRYLGFKQKMRRKNKKILSRNRYSMWVLKRLTQCYAGNKEANLKEYAMERYSLLIQYRFAKWLHRNKLLT